MPVTLGIIVQDMFRSILIPLSCIIMLCVVIAVALSLLSVSHNVGFWLCFSFFPNSYKEFSASLFSIPGFFFCPATKCIYENSIYRQQQLDLAPGEQAHDSDNNNGKKRHSF
jgi:hypothetical protein